MDKKLALMIAAAAMLLPNLGCSQSKTAPGTATTATSEEPNDRVTDREVIQAAATEETTSTPGGESGQIGSTAPVWQNLTGTDDKQHGLADLADAKAVVVIFTCNTCPVAQAYEDRLVQLANDYKDKGVELVAINVNNTEGDKLPAMKERAEEKGFTFAYLYDPTQRIARDYGAAVTPHAFVLNDQRKIIYAGAIDDNQSASAAQQQYLRDAIDATLAGREPEVTSKKPVGCSIKYE